MHSEKNIFNLLTNENLKKQAKDTKIWYVKN